MPGLVTLSARAVVCSLLSSAAAATAAAHTTWMPHQDDGIELSVHLTRHLFSCCCGCAEYQSAATSTTQTSGLTAAAIDRAMAQRMWQLACLLLLAAGSMAAAAEPATDVEAATFKQCPRACRNQRIDPATYCRTCSACAGYKKRCAGEQHPLTCVCRSRSVL